jgi:hypothetical protein
MLAAWTDADEAGARNGAPPRSSRRASARLRLVERALVDPFASLDEDYGSAVLHLAWAIDRKAKTRSLRVVKEAGRVSMEVVEHLSTLPDAEVDVTLEIRVRVPEGVKDDVVRTVSETANTLKFQNFSFERE